MTLQDYDRTVKPHLQFIEIGASMAARHARILLQRPSFETLAEDELSKVRETLTAALAKVVLAQHAYRDTPDGA